MLFAHSDRYTLGKGVFLRAQTNSLGLCIEFGDERVQKAGLILLALLSVVTSKPPRSSLLPLPFTFRFIIVFIACYYLK